MFVRLSVLTLSVTNSFIPDFSFLPLEAVHLYILCCAIFLFRLGVKKSKLGRYAGERLSNLIHKFFTFASLSGGFMLLARS